MRISTPVLLSVVVAVVLSILATSAVAAPAAPWQDSHAYVQGDFVRTSGDPAASTYVCRAAHTSSATNLPPNATNWMQVWPQDASPVSAGGDGPSQNDWDDFSYIDLPVVLQGRSGGVNDLTKTTRAIRIDPGNPTFVLANNRSDDGQKLRHWEIEDDFGATGLTSVVDGDAYWDWYYGGYTPAVAHKADTHVTIRRNCVSYAYHHYKSNNAVLTSWVDPTADANPLRVELGGPIAVYIDMLGGALGRYATLPGDRCDIVNVHVWFITNAGCLPKPNSLEFRDLEWKNNSSAIYTWRGTDNFNDAPKGDLTTNSASPLYYEFNVYRKH